MSLVAFCVLGLSSCGENDSPAFSSNVLKNTELRNILTSKGFSFDKEGKLELNELATSTVHLTLVVRNLQTFRVWIFCQI